MIEETLNKFRDEGKLSRLRLLQEIRKMFQDSLTQLIQEKRSLLNELQDTNRFILSKQVDVKKSFQISFDKKQDDTNKFQEFVMNKIDTYVRSHPKDKESMYNFLLWLTDNISKEVEVQKQIQEKMQEDEVQEQEEDRE